MALMQVGKVLTSVLPRKHARVIGFSKAVCGQLAQSRTLRYTHGMGWPSATVTVSEQVKCTSSGTALKTHPSFPNTDHTKN